MATCNRDGVIYKRHQYGTEKCKQCNKIAPPNRLIEPARRNDEAVSTDVVVDKSTVQPDSDSAGL